MSYDLIFLPKGADQTWEEAIDAVEAAADHDATRPSADVWTRLVAAAEQVLGEVSEFEGDNNYALDHESTGIQLSYHATEAEITVPYWYRGDDARQIVQLIYRLGEAVERVTGLPGFDPQLDLPLADAATRVELAVTAFDQVAASFAARGIDSPSNG
ncbi:hypothetical protein [Asanoa sp. NPDC050611]|uniref:hypothetical protein n=1 Tax=Asanoa sp. NPDC050611 TaxID=3157098 RepID=UPI0033EC3E68